MSPYPFRSLVAVVLLIGTLTTPVLAQQAEETRQPIFIPFVNGSESGASLIEEQEAPLAQATYPTPPATTVPAEVAESMEPATVNTIKVTLDPGHGWRSDSGAAANGMLEKDIALDIANRVKPLLEARGIEVSMTRTGDEPNLGLEQAAIRANSYAADIVVSIHVNAGGGTGTESCYTVDLDTSAESRRLASLLTSYVSSSLNLRLRGNWPENSAGYCVRNRWTPPYLYIHWMEPPTALIETAFIDGPSDVDVAMLRDRRSDFATAIARGIFEYFGIGSGGCPSINAWKGEYWNNTSLSGNLTLCRNDGSVDFDWGQGGPGGGVPNDHFSARWTRNWNFTSSGRYRFHLRGDDGIRLWVDGNLIIDQWKDQGRTEYTAERELSAGSHSLKVEYYENGGDANVALWWDFLGGGGPSNCPSISAWQGEYWNNTSLSGSRILCRNDDILFFDWGQGGPGGGVPNDHFSARWTRNWNFPSSGRYRFFLSGDDGIRLWVDGNLIIDQWKDQGRTEYTAERELSAGSHSLKVEYYENGGDANVYLLWNFLGGGGPSNCPSISAWQGEYWNNTSLSGSRILCRNDGSVDFDWGQGGPGAGVPNNGFSARWTRNWNFTSSGRYRFHLRGDDGIRLWVDGNLIIDQWKDQGRTEYTAERELSAGSHSLKVEYYENGGDANVALWWDFLGGGGPSNCPSISAWQGEYWNNKDLSGNRILCRNDGSVDFDWGQGGPGGGVPNDGFSARWTRNWNFTQSGRYRFHLRGDDGIRLWVDGNLIIDQWKDQGRTEYTAERELSAGSHSLKVEYYENGGDANVALWWDFLGGGGPSNCPNQYRAEYYNNRTLNGNPTFVTCEGWPISHDWGYSGPGNGIGTDGFSVRWTSRARIESGTYNFIARSDDGIRVWIGGALIIDQWKDQGPTEYRVTRTMSSGDYEIKVEYYENGGSAVAQFRWERQSGTSCSGANIGLDQTHSGNLSSSTPYVNYCFSGSADQWISIRMFAFNSSVDTLIRLYGPGGQLISEDDDGAEVQGNSFLVLRLPANGTYRLEATRFNETTAGAYRMRLVSGRAATIADIDLNCVVNEQDRQQVQSQIGTSDWKTDVNLDNIVNSVDHTLVLTRIGRTCNSVAVASTEKTEKAEQGIPWIFLPQIGTMQDD